MNKEEFETLNRLASEKLRELALECGLDLAFIEDRTQKVDTGWVFFYNTREFVSTGDPTAALAGNGPIFVTNDGTVHLLPSSIPWKRAVKELGRNG